MDKMRVFERKGVIFASSGKAWEPSTIVGILRMAKASSAGLQAVRRAPDGTLWAYWRTGPLCSQAGGVVAGVPVVHVLNDDHPPKPDYFKYIASPGWLKRTRSAKRRQNYVCADCGRSTPYLQCNHVSYQRLGNELPADLVALCDRCHRRQHGLG